MDTRETLVGGAWRRREAKRPRPRNLKRPSGVSHPPDAAARAPEAIKGAREVSRRQWLDASTAAYQGQAEVREGIGPTRRRLLSPSAAGSYQVLPVVRRPAASAERTLELLAQRDSAPPLVGLSRRPPINTSRRRRPAAQPLQTSSYLQQVPLISTPALTSMSTAAAPPRAPPGLPPRPTRLNRLPSLEQIRAKVAPPGASSHCSASTSYEGTLLNLIGLHLSLIACFAFE